MSLAGEIAAGQGLAGVASMIFFGRGILSLANRSRGATCPPCERVEDLFSGLLPHEGPRVAVPLLDPVADVGLKCLDALVDAALEHLGGEVSVTGPPER